MCVRVWAWVGEPSVRGCGCTGDGGWAHVRCLTAQAAKEGEDGAFSPGWFGCRACGEPFRGDVKLAMARECRRTYAARGEADPLLIMSLSPLGEALAAKRLDLEAATSGVARGCFTVTFHLLRL